MLLRLPQGQKPPLGARIDWSNPLTEGLEAFWLFNEGAGRTVNDLSMMRHHSTNYANWDVSSRGVALRFDFTADDYVDTTVTLDPTTSSFTIEVLTFLTALPADVGTHLIAVQQTDGTGLGRSLVYVSLATGRWSSYLGGADRDSGIAAVKFQWQHVFFVWDLNNSTWKFVINDVDGGSGTLTPEFADGNWLIGKHKSLAYYYKGLISYVRIYNRPLAREEMRKLYRDPFCYIKTPMHWYDYIGIVKLTVSDSGTGVDSVLADKTFPLSDLASGADTFILDKTFTLEELASSLEQILTNKNLLLADVSIGDDSVLADKIFVIVDSVAGVDSLVRDKEFSLSDAATGSDSLLASKNLTINESGLLNELISADKIFFISDSVTAEDLTLINKVFSIADTGIAIDTIDAVIEKILKLILANKRPLSLIIVNKHALKLILSNERLITDLENKGGG